MRKKINIIILFITVAAFSCKKNHSKDDPGSSVSKAHTVTLTINPSGFLQSISNNSKLNVNSTVNPSDFKNYIDTLYISFAGKVYTYNTKNLTAINIPSQQLFPGTYKAFAFGGKKGFRFDQSYLVAYYAPADPQNFLSSGLWQDSFAALQSFTVSDADVTVNLSLARIDAALEVVIQDKLPSNVSYFTVDVSKEYYFYYPANDLAYDTYPNEELRAPGAMIKYVVADTSKGKPNFTMDRIMLNTNSNFYLTISAYDSANSLIASKVVSNIKLTKNQKSILTGTLFGGSTSNAAGSTLPVKADTSWNSTPILKPF
jgi:hypothetical protein